jgi:hypothetical protein
VTRVPILYSRGYGLVLTLMGLRPRASYIELDDDLVRVRLGWAFHTSFNRYRIESAERTPDVLMTAGAHGWRGRWLVNGASGPIVTIRLREPVSAFALGFPIRLREIAVSVADPDALIAALSPRPAP